MKQTVTVETIPIGYKFYYMKDNHTFIKLEGETLKQIKEHAIECAICNPWGLVCPALVIDLRDDAGREIGDRIGPTVHVRSGTDQRFLEELDDWYLAIKKVIEPVIL